MTGTLRHCGIPAITPWQCVRGLAASPSQEPWPELDGHRTLWTYSGRTAIALACRALRLKPGEEVLAPAYNCGTELDPLVSCGADVVFYRVRPDTSIDEDDLRRRATSRTRLLYVTHYFGWPQQLAQLRHWCTKRGIAMLEDGALALFSRSGSTPVGSVGDAAVFSFPKWFAVPDGGALLLRREFVRQEGFALQEPPASRVLRRTLPLLKSHGLQMAERIGAYGTMRRLLDRRDLPPDTRPNDGMQDIPKHYYFAAESIGWGPSTLTRSVLSRIDSRQIIASRRRNYAHLLDALRGVADVTPLHDALPDGVCPLVFPLLVERRADYVRALNSHGIAAIPWWSGYHRSFVWRDFPEARRLKDNILALPLHHELDTSHIEYVAERIRLAAAARSGV